MLQLLTVSESDAIKSSILKKKKAIDNLYSSLSYMEVPPDDLVMSLSNINYNDIVLLGLI